MKSRLRIPVTLAAVAFGAVLAATPTVAQAYMPGDAVVRYTAHVPGIGWLAKKEAGYVIGPSDTSRRITGIRVTVETPGGSLYGRGYGVCYSTKQANSAWSSEVCNGSTSGVLTGSQMERFRIRLVTPAEVAANVCYTVTNGSNNDEFEERKCDGGAAPLFVSGYKILKFYLYVTGDVNRGPHTRSISDLTSSQRTFLASKIHQCVTEGTLDRHSQIGHEFGPQLLEDHRILIWELEKCLVISGAGQFVPIPYWNPGEILPPEARGVKSFPGRDTPALLRSETWKGEYDASKFGTHTPWDLFWYPTVGEFANWSFVSWHNGVHGNLGGVMDGNHMPVAPTAIAFWLYHAYLDNIYEQWQRNHP